MIKPARSSALPGYELCHGRPAAEVDMPDSKNELSVRGDIIHAMMASNDFSAATPDQMDSIGSLVRMSAQVEEDIIGSRRRTKVVKEREFTIKHDGVDIIVGHPDRVLIWDHDGEERALILDFKTGFLEVDSAEDNLQLLCYAVAVWQELGIKRIFAKIIMPMSKGHHVVEYDGADLKAGLDHLLFILAATKKPDAPRTPSEIACRYCKALGTSRCSETSKIVEEAASENIMVAHYSPEAIAKRLELFSIAEKIIKKEEAEFKAMLAKDPEAIPGYYLKPGNIIGKIFNAQKTFEIVEPLFIQHLKDTGVVVEEIEDKAMAMFQACVTVSKGKIEDAIAEATGLKGQVLDAKCEALLASVIVESQNAPSLSKMPKAMLKEKGLIK